MKKPTGNLTLPDKFVLDKKIVLFVVKNVQKHWKRNDFNALENAAYIANMEIIKSAVRMNSTKVLREIFFSVITAVHQIETLNSLKLSTEDSEKINELFEIQMASIESGEAFIDN